MLQCAVLVGIARPDRSPRRWAPTSRAMASWSPPRRCHRPGRGRPARRVPLRGPSRARRVALFAQVGTSHAAARLADRIPPGARRSRCTWPAAAAWIGGIPYFLLALGACRDGIAWRRIGRRFSLMSMARGGGCCSPAASPWRSPISARSTRIYGTAYGVMVATKALLLLLPLLLGGMNYLLVERLRRDPATPILRLRRFAEVEIGIGITVLFAAASLTSQPPAVDLTTDRASLHEIAERLTPEWPRLTSPDHASLALSELQARLDRSAAAGRAARRRPIVPGEGCVPPRNAEDIAWSEYNHHWSGIFVLAIGLLALAERTGHAPWARHWPLLFLGLAVFLFIRSDPEVWPLGDCRLLGELSRSRGVAASHFRPAHRRLRASSNGACGPARLHRPGAALVFPLHHGRRRRAAPHPFACAFQHQGPAADRDDPCPAGALRHHRRLGALARAAPRRPASRIAAWVWPVASCWSASSCCFIARPRNDARADRRPSSKRAAAMPDGSLPRSSRLSVAARLLRCASTSASTPISTSSSIARSAVAPARGRARSRLPAEQRSPGHRHRRARRPTRPTDATDALAERLRPQPDTLPTRAPARWRRLLPPRTACSSCGKAEVQDFADQLIAAQPLLGTLAADPEPARPVRRARPRAAGGRAGRDRRRPRSTRPFTAVADAASKRRSPAATRRSPGKTCLPGASAEPQRAAPFHLGAADARLQRARAGQARATQRIRAAAQELGLTPEHGVRVRLTGPVPLSDEEFATVAEGAGFGDGAVARLLCRLAACSRCARVRLVVAILAHVARRARRLTAAFAVPARRRRST